MVPWTGHEGRDGADYSHEGSKNLASTRVFLYTYRRDQESGAGEHRNIWLAKLPNRVARQGKQPSRAARIDFSPVWRTITGSPWYPTSIRIPTAWGAWSVLPT